MSEQSLVKASSESLTEVLVDRFLSYVAIPSQSQAGTGQVPSSEGQWVLAKLLKAELERLGLVDIHLSEFCVLTAKLPGNVPAGTAPTIGFLAHLDTVNVNLDDHIYPQRLRYEGGDVCLNEADGIYMRLAEHPELSDYEGQEILFSSGHSVLGADDKASVASIMTAVDYFLQNPELPRGDVYVGFVPDEEIGLVGAKHMDLSRFPVEFAYTLDCCQLGEVVFQTFNAGSGHVHIKGVSAHPMSAKGVLVNPTLVAVDLVNGFNRLETPENTEGTEGYIWVQSIQSNQSEAQVLLNIRDHNKEKYEAKKAYIRELVSTLQTRYPRAEISLDIEDVYGNIEDALTDDNRQAVDYIYEAMDILGIKPRTIAMRGGTDGSYLSTQGIPTPNFFTGAHNFHSPCEFLPLPSFEKACRMILTIVDLVAKKK